MGFAGTVNGSFFEAPEWVDKSMKPGRTNQSKVYGDWGAVIKGYLSTAFFFLSPNFTWFTIAALTYYLFPYDFEEAAKGYRPEWVGFRLLVNTFVTFSYFGFWNLSLYAWGWGKRKFNSTKNPTASRMFHNMFYSFLGCLQWTVWECFFIRAYATGRLGYVSDSEIFSNWQSALKFAAWCLFVPLWRDFHFYFAHRLLHIRPLYKFVHSLHHRNDDIEPFSGLCMHPVEHLFYFGCVGPSLYIHASPFIMMWNGIHLLISPAASHSGWEDHFQSDQFHYLHHAKFECNYGTSGPPLDKMFGTFREKLGRSLTYSGVAEDIKEIVQTPNEFLSGSLSISKSLPDRLDSVFYNSLVYATFALFVCKEVGLYSEYADKFSAAEMGFLIAMGPAVFGMLVLAMFGDNKATFYPFHKEALFGPLGFHTIFQTIMVVMPVYHFVTTVLQPKGDSVYCALYDSANCQPSIIVPVNGTVA